MQQRAKRRGFGDARWVTSILVTAFAASCVFATTTNNDIIVGFPGITVADPALLLYSGKEGSGCVEYEGAIASPTVTLHDVSIDATCQVEFDGFAPGWGAYAVDADRLT